MFKEKKPEEIAQIYSAHQLGNILMVNNIVFTQSLYKFEITMLADIHSDNVAKLGFHLDISWWKCIL